MKSGARKFIRFLRERKIKYKHRYNFDKYKIASKDNLSYENFIKSDKYFMFFDAFLWRRTDEGDGFWADFEDEWKEYRRHYSRRR